MAHPKNERSFVAIKPDGVQRSLIGEIIGRLERAGLKLTAVKMVIPTEDQCWVHYNKDDAWFLQKGERMIESRRLAGLPADKPALEYGKDIVRALVKFMTSGPVVVMVWEGNQAVGIVKKIVGGTEPLNSDVGTIRGDLTVDSYDLAGADERAVRNLIHCSDRPEEAEREIAIWFKEKEVVKYNHLQEKILYDVNLDGILE